MGSGISSLHKAFILYVAGGAGRWVCREPIKPLLQIFSWVLLFPLSEALVSKHHFLFQHQFWIDQLPGKG